MDTHETTSPTTLRGNLSRSLRAFVANARHTPISPKRWLDLKSVFLSNLDHENHQILQHAIVVLKKERNSVGDAEWNTFTASVVDRLTCRDDSTLLKLLLDKIFGDESSSSSLFHIRKREGEDVHLVSNRKRPRTSSLETVNNKDKASNISSTIFADTFCLLRSEYIPSKLHTIALDEILTVGADLAVICNYKFDIPWLWERAPALQTSRKILILHGETDAEEAEWRSFLYRNGVAKQVRFHRPVTPPYGTVHSKIFLLFFPNGCRVCIHTANMIACDWDFKTQGAYVRDFPLAERVDPADSSDYTVGNDDFRIQLERYFRRACSGQDRDEVVCLLSKYDFSTAGVALVSSTPGVHKGSSKTQFGHARLRELLSRESIPERDEQAVAICQFSSLGSIQKKWLEEEFRDTLFASSQRKSNDGIKRYANDEIKFVYPTVQQVQQSNEGIQAGGSLPVPSKNINRDHILCKLHKWDARHSGRQWAMPHIKTFLRHSSSQPQSPSWMLMGSFNLSVAAWGRMQGARKGKESWDRLNILSYEIGVLFTPRFACPPAHAIDGSIKYCLPTAPEKEMWRIARESKRVTFEVVSSFSDTTENLSGVNENETSLAVILKLPLPYRVPPPKYTPTDTAWTIDYYEIS